MFFISARSRLAASSWVSFRFDLPLSRAYLVFGDDQTATTQKSFP
jgi:hypothetical protein